MGIQHIPNCSCKTCTTGEKYDMVHVHVHSDHSNLDGVNRIDRLVKKAAKMGQKALSLNDHGNPSGIFQFYKACKKEGIKPILGLEFYITNDLEARVSNKDREFEDRDWHQSIFIKNTEGYKNYNYLTYVSFNDGYYYKPRIDYDLLFSRAKGLIATSSCIASKINNYITAGKTADAEKLFKRFRDVFGDDFYGEIQLNELNDMEKFGISQKMNNQFIIDMCKKYDVPVLIGGDIHYLDPEDNELQDAIINSKRMAKEGEEGFKIHARTLYLSGPEDVIAFNTNYGFNYDIKFLEECFENSLKFAQKVDFDFEMGKYHMPKIKTEGMSSEKYLDKVTWAGLRHNIETERKYFPEKFTNDEIDEMEQRVDTELEIIKNMGVADYMLIVHDIIKWEKKNNIYVGAGRGSAVGSAVAYALGITSLNPIEHGLLFERFINPNRKQMPDIDWDQELGAREKVLEYLIETYGQESVCNVATFGTYGPKSALQDMSRGLRKDTGNDTILSRKIVKLPELAKEGVDKWKPKDGEMIQYFKALRQTNRDPDILNWIDNNEDTIRLSDKLCGQMKNLGTHAGGIVVTPEPIYNLIPVTRGSGNMITAFSEADGSEKQLSELGILKLDVLGLNTLNVLKECVEKIYEDTGLDLKEKIDYLPLDDQKMLKYFATGNNYGIFQMDRSAMFTSRFREDGGPLDSFADIVVINAMNRPGPLEAFLPKYGYWKAIDQGRIKIEPDELAIIDKERYPFEFMRKSLSPTYGCLLFQEQFMQMICDVTGMTFGDADSFRRALAWKADNPKFHTVKGYFDKLEESMAAQGYSTEDVEKFLQYCRDFMGYSFNKCVSGSTKFLRHTTTISKTRTIEQLWKCMNEPGYAKRNGMLSVRKDINKHGWGSSFSLDSNKELIKNEIVDIRFEGKKKTYTLELVTGQKIDATDNHKFPTSNGEKEMKDIDIENDYIYVIASTISTKVTKYPTKLIKVKSITFKGEENVYDVEMAAPTHTFAIDNGIVTSNSHSVAYSYISWQTLFFKVYYPSYFYAAMLNAEDKTEKIQEIIEDARKNSIKVLNLSIVASEYYSKAEGPDAVRLGYNLIKGMGAAVENELKVLELHKCLTIDEVLQKPFKKVNSSALNNLIRLGCFDELGVERELIETLKELYKEPKIEKWFTRKRSPAEEKTMPEILLNTFGAEEVMKVVPDVIEAENPQVALISRLTPLLKPNTYEKDDAKKLRLQKETINAELELLGFAVSNDDAFGDFARSMRSAHLVPISEWEEDLYCYFKIVKINEAKTKAGKTYWVYLLNDGRKDFKAKVWNENKKAYDGAYCIGGLDNHPNFGWTLLKCEIVK